MKMKSFFLCLFLALTACYFSSLPAQAQPNASVQLAAKPDKWYFDSANYLVIMPHENKNGSFLKFGYQGHGFPAGTQIKLHHNDEYNNDTPWEVQYLLPGKNWRPLLWSQLQCKDKQCEEEEPPPAEDKPKTESKEEEPEKFQCVPILGPLALGALGYFAAESTKSSAETSHTKAEVSVDPAVGAAAGILVGVAVECGIRYLVWKDQHPKK